VRVAKSERRDVAFELRAIGNVEAWSSVAVKPRVAGQLLKVHVRDGADVKEGDLLFEIDPLPFLENVRAAEAALARDVAAEKQAVAAIARAQAQAANARAQAERYSALFREGVGAREQMDQYTTAADAQEAQLNAEKAALESARAAMRADEARLAEAKLQLSYTKVHAPGPGRAGFVGIKAGNLVRENDTAPVVTILQIQPAWVSFGVPEGYLNEIRRAAASSPRVDVVDEAGGGVRATGRLDVIDNAVDAATGTIKLKARFENSSRELWPGQFVNVVMQLRTDRGVVTVPNAALQDGPEGRYVWVVSAEGKAQMRAVQVARVQGNTAVIAGGLNEGETVVTFGQLGVRDGTAVRILGAGQ
jgi:multidrug efflux system membrane fusion protein